MVDTGNWMRERQILISPYSVNDMDRESGTVHVHLTRQQVRDSPNIDTHKPVLRQHETEYLLYYGYPTYRGGSNLWGMGAYPAFDAEDVSPDAASEALPRPVLSCRGVHCISAAVLEIAPFVPAHKFDDAGPQPGGCIERF